MWPVVIKPLPWFIRCPPQNLKQQQQQQQKEWLSEKSI